MADCASSLRAVIAQSDPSSRPTACSVPVALPVQAHSQLERTTR